MKQLLLLAVCLAVMATAQAQNTSYSAREYYAHSKKPYDKVYVQADPGNYKIRKEHTDEKTGELSVTIIRQDSAKMYMLDPARKTYIALSLSQMNDPNALMGVKIVDGRTVERKFIGMENVNGFECHHYVQTTTYINTNGKEEKGLSQSWMYEPLNVQMQFAEGGYSEPIYLGDFRQGPQPTHLFEIPRGYTGSTLPGGGLNEMMKQSTGTSFEDLIKAKETLDRKNKGTQEKLDDIKNDQSKTEQQKIIEALKMMGGDKKK